MNGVGEKWTSLKMLKMAILFLFLLSPALTLRLRPHDYMGGRSRDEYDRMLRNRSAAAIILGEIRSSMSDIMFIKTERYLHSGIAYKLNLDYDALSSKGQVRDMGRTPAIPNAPQGRHEVTTKAHEHEHEPELPPGEEDIFHCEGADTVIRTQARDFRGFIGDLQREVKPWIDPLKPHLHTDGTELLPWYRLMTLSDPHYIRGYMIGAWWLKRQRTKTQIEAAVNFLEEGIRNNPGAFQLYLMRGEIMHTLERNQEAKRSYREAAELAAKQRPAGGKTSARWTEYNEEDALASMRLAVLSEREFGSKKEALALARRYLAVLEHDAILENLIKRLEQ
jgi:tetratricopeptide (TPR) repeat protein